MRNTVWLLIVSTACAQSVLPAQSPRLTTQAVPSYYVNCAALSAGNGTSSSPWNNLAVVNAKTFAAGDSILFNRGTTCSGMLWPKGSGAAGALITLGAYGSGAKPIIAGGGGAAAIKLYNQHHWRIENLETSGGNPYGVYVAGNAATTLDGLQLVGLTVRDVGGTATKKESGLIVVTPESKDTAFSNVLIDGVNAYNTQQWAGILVGGDDYEALGYSGSVASNNVTIRNSSVSNTYGDGIVVFHAKNALIETSLVHNVGKNPSGAVGTPNGIWMWWCDTCTVQSNEVYNMASPGVDGGAFDIDYWSVNNIIQYNYGHDNQGYCLAVFGAGGRATTGSVVRYNVCANNGRLAGNTVQIGSKQGDFYTATWNGGSIDGLQVYNNTFYWNPASSEPAVVNKGANMTGSNAFRNNLIVSTVDKLIWSDSNLAFNNNQYFYTNGPAAWWGYNGGWWNTLSAYQSGSGQDSAGRYGDPLLNSSGYHAVGRPSTQYTLQSGSPAINLGVDVGVDVGGMGGRDFYGNTAPSNGAYDIGANESGSGAASVSLVQNSSFESGATNWANWWDSSVNASSAAYFNAQGGHSGGGRLTHWSAAAPFRQYASQDIAGLTAGTYTLNVWTQTSSGLSKISIGGKNCNGSATQELSLSTAANGTWTQSSTQVTVGGSSCQVFAWSESGGQAERWVNFDDLEFTRN